MEPIRYFCPGCGQRQEILIGPLATEADRQARPPCAACLEAPPPLPERLHTVLRYGALATVRAAREETLRLPWAATWLAEGEKVIDAIAHPDERDLKCKVWRGLGQRRFTKPRSLEALRDSAR